jgi:hypothetical protein
LRRAIYLVFWSTIAVIGAYSVANEVGQYPLGLTGAMIACLFLGWHSTQSHREGEPTETDHPDGFDSIVCSRCGSSDLEIPWNGPRWWAKCKSCGAILNTGYTIQPVDVEGIDREIREFMHSVCKRCPFVVGAEGVGKK